MWSGYDDRPARVAGRMYRLEDNMVCDKDGKLVPEPGGQPMFQELRAHGRRKAIRGIGAPAYERCPSAMLEAGGTTSRVQGVPEPSEEDSRIIVAGINKAFSKVVRRVHAEKSGVDGECGCKHCKDKP